MKKKIYLHKNQKVIVWRVDEYNSIHGFRLVVFYSYLRGLGQIGHERVRKVFEQDYYEEFHPTNDEIDIHWMYKLAGSNQ